MLARTANLKTKFTILENYAEVVKKEENNYYKHITQLRKEIQSRSTGLKDVLCKYIDVLTEKTSTLLKAAKAKTSR